MIHLLFMLVIGEMALILTLMFKSPIRKLVILSMDQMKQGRGPLVMKSVGGTMVVIFISTIYVVMGIQKRSTDAAGVVNPTDEVLKAQHLLQASLIGFSLFLALMIDRLHYYIRELSLLRRALEAFK
ncbi:uncharacterized protein LOC115725724 isoform X1 [Cannabis sativa]|uniref:uncharacterized protein LOC115725724 isoform X1 n=1 Tax=Cannabis sativa TaxID=3483 RepID=UPI0011E05F94|nr:uncharacterized protein LOC115725724 isoform X1 [Cannabis sativa]